MFLPAILILACASSSLVFCMMYSEAKKNKQSDNIQPRHTSLYSFLYLEPFHCSMFHSNCCFLTCLQLSREAGKVVWYSHLFKNFPKFVVIHTVKGFSVVSDTEVGVFLTFSCFLEVSNLICGSSVFSKSSLYVWKFLVHVLLKPSLENFEHYFASTNTMKRQKDMTLKAELPRLVDAQCATGREQRNSSKDVKRPSQSKNNAQLWMSLVVEVKSDAVKNSV